MHSDVTLKAQDFKTIHNTLWELQYGNAINVDAAVEKIRAALADCYRQDDEVFQARSDHYSDVRASLGLDAIWSMYEVEDLGERHAFAGVTTMTYKDNWGGDAFSVPINGFTWAALYVAANAAIRDSGDEHHVFIEGFTKVGNTLLLITGS
jgi:hypothetical protein